MALIYYVSILVLSIEVTSIISANCSTVALYSIDTITTMSQSVLREINSSPCIHWKD